MILRLVMIGSGADLDPYRADLPSYATLGTDAVNMAITVSLAPRQVPPQIPDQGAPYWSVENGVPILVDMPESMLMAWWAKLGSQYPQHVPPFTPGFL